MAKQNLHQIQVKSQSLEWLYVPDYVYSNENGIERKLQMIIPYKRIWDEDKKFPLVLFIPGAAWHRQEMYNGIPYRAELAKRGFVTADVQVRESDIDIFPAAITDVKRAIRFLYTIADQYHIDMNHIFLAGESAGGHMALLAGLTAATGEFDPEFDSEKPCKVNGIISISGPTDMFLSKGTGPMEAFIGTDCMSHAVERATAASCGTYVTKEREIPPILMIHGQEDCIVTIEHSRSFYRKLQQYDKEVDFYEVINENHGGPTFWGKEILDIVEGFIKKHCN